MLDRHFGFYMDIGWPSEREIIMLGVFIVLGAFAGLVPAWRALNQTVADGMTVRI